MINIGKLLCCLSVCLLLTSCESPRKQQYNEPVVIKVSRNEKEPNYTVREGDTVGSIAHQHNITRSDLIELNNLTPPYELYEGQKLIVESNKFGSYSGAHNITDDYNETNSNNSDSTNIQSDIEKTENNKYSNERVITINSDISNTEEQNNGIQNGNILVEDSPDRTHSEDDKSSKYIWPVDKSNNKILKHFKDTKAYTIIQSPSGSAVKAISDGVVKFAGTSQSEGTLGYGKMVVVKHDNPSRITVYAKLGNTNVKRGQKVKKGQKIGTVANNGKLYFSVMNSKKNNKRVYIDPESIID